MNHLIPHQEYNKDEMRLLVYLIFSCTFTNTDMEIWALVIEAFHITSQKNLPVENNDHASSPEINVMMISEGYADDIGIHS